MQKKLFLTLCMAMITQLASAKTVIVYYSYTNNVRTVVNNLKSQIDADVVEVLPTEDGVKYDANNYAIGSDLITAIRNNPKSASSYPDIRTTFSNWADYNTVIIATPLWWGNMSAIMQSFLFKYGAEMAGKNVGLIATSGSSGISGVESDAKRLVPDGNWFSKSLHVRVANVSSSSSAIATWLSDVNYASLTAEQTQQKINISVNGYNLTATLADNSSATALIELLGQGQLTIETRDYGDFEKVGRLPQSLPRNDEYISTTAGDIILYLGNSIVFYYDTNDYSFTRLGRIDNVENLNLREIYGSGNATFVLSLPGATAIKAVPNSNNVLYEYTFSMDGRKISNREQMRQPYIVRQVMEDGSVKVQKRMR